MNELKKRWHVYQLELKQFRLEIFNKILVFSPPLVKNCNKAGNTVEIIVMGNLIYNLVLNNFVLIYVRT